MQIIFLILAVFCPLCILAAFIVYYNHVRYSLVLLTVIAAGAVFLCGIVETGCAALLDTVLHKTLYATVHQSAQTAVHPLTDSAAVSALLHRWAAAIIEESIKLCVWCGIAGFCVKPRTKEQQTHSLLPESAGTVPYRYCVMYALFFGCAFGSFETFSYTIRYAGSLPYRLLSATVLHGTLTSFYCTFRYRPSGYWGARIALWLYCIGLPIFLHGLYNMFSEAGGICMVFAYTIVLFSCLNTYTVFKNAAPPPSLLS